MSPVCVGAPDKHVVSRSFLSRFTVVQGPKAEASQLKERDNWKASRATSERRTSAEYTYLVLWTTSEPGYLALRTRLETWNSRGVDQVGPGNSFSAKL